MKIKFSHIGIFLVMALVLVPSILSYDASARRTSAQVGNLPPQYQNVFVTAVGEEMQIVLVVTDYNSYYDIERVVIDILDINSVLVSSFEYVQRYVERGSLLAPQREDIFRNIRGGALNPSKCSVSVELFPVEYIERNSITITFSFKHIDGIELIIKTFDRQQESAIIRVQYATSWFGTVTGDPVFVLPVFSGPGTQVFSSTLYASFFGIVVAAVCINIRLWSNKWAKKMEDMEQLEHGWYYSISVVTLGFFSFLAAFMSAKFALIFLLASGFTPEFISYLTPLILIDGLIDFHLVFSGTVLAIINAALHFKHNQKRILLSTVITAIMIAGMGTAVFKMSYDIGEGPASTWFMFFALVLMLIFDNQSYLNYPIVLKNLKHNYCTKCRLLWRISQKGTGKGRRMVKKDNSASEKAVSKKEVSEKTEGNSKETGEEDLI